VTDPGALRPALLNFAYWPEVRRGNERLVHDLATELARRGGTPAIVTSHPGRTERSVEEGVDVIRRWRPPDAPLRLRRFQPNLTHIPFTYRELVRGDFDLAHAFFPTDALAATRWRAATGRPAVFTITGVMGRENVANLRLRKRLLENALAGSDAVVTISRAARDAIWRWLAIEPRVIYPGVDLDHFRPGDRAERPTIACASDPGDARKRVDLLVRAFSRVRGEWPDAELLLMRPADPALAARLGSEPGVRLLAADADTAPRMLAAAWVSALCSLREAFGLVLVESLACGTPVVASRDGALPEIIDRPEVGVLFDGDDERDVADALRRALALARDGATAAACRERAGQFSSGATAAAHEELYRELIGSSRPS
jgi:glycosyltransferase involved in cell wall biosynthesis